MKALLSVLGQYAEEKGFIDGKVGDCRGSYKPHWPRGIYLGLNIDSPHCGGIWKIDIWALEPHEFDKNQQLLTQIKEKLTDTKRALILEMKQALMEGHKRVPPMASHWLYQAILFHGLSEKETIFKFLKEKAIIQ
jgi:hypothetical protein